VKETLRRIQLVQEQWSPSLPELAAVIEARLAAAPDRTIYLGQIGAFIASALAGAVPDPQEYD
jgi:hypothetical protein